MFRQANVSCEWDRVGANEGERKRKERERERENSEKQHAVSWNVWMYEWSGRLYEPQTVSMRLSQQKLLKRETMSIVHEYLNSWASFSLTQCRANTTDDDDVHDIMDILRCCRQYKLFDRSLWSFLMINTNMKPKYLKKQTWINSILIRCCSRVSIDFVS